MGHVHQVSLGSSRHAAPLYIPEADGISALWRCCVSAVASAHSRSWDIAPLSFFSFPGMTDAAANTCAGHAASGECLPAID